MNNTRSFISRSLTISFLVFPLMASANSQKYYCPQSIDCGKANHHADQCIDDGKPGWNFLSAVIGPKQETDYVYNERYDLIGADALIKVGSSPHSRKVLVDCLYRRSKWWQNGVDPRTHLYYRYVNKQPNIHRYEIVEKKDNPLSKWNYSGDWWECTGPGWPFTISPSSCPMSFDASGDDSANSGNF